MGFETYLEWKLVSLHDIFSRTRCYILSSRFTYRYSTICEFKDNQQRFYLSEFLNGMHDRNEVIWIYISRGFDHVDRLIPYLVEEYFTRL